MIFDPPLKQGSFLKRYKRFFADIEYQGSVVTAHCPNTGSMKGVNTPNSLCMFSHNNDPKRKLKYSLEMLQTPTSWVGVNTGRANKLVYELWQSTPLPHWIFFDNAATEVKVSDKSRIDLVLWNNKNFSGKKPKIEEIQSHSSFHFIEVKNVSLAEEGVAMFPDAVSSRGQKHIQELVQLIEQGHSAEIFFCVQREDCNKFRAAHGIDPEYAKLLKEAHSNGLKITAVAADLSPSAIRLKPCKQLETLL